MDRLPGEVLQAIFLLVNSPDDLFRLSRVCHFWHSLVFDEVFLREYLSRRWSRQIPVTRPFCQRDVHPAPADYLNHPIPSNLLTPSSLLCQSESLYGLIQLKSIDFSSFSISFWIWVPNEDDCLVIDINRKSRIRVVFWGRPQQWNSQFQHIFYEPTHVKEHTLARTWVHMTFNWKQEENGLPPIYSFWLNGEKPLTKESAQKTENNHILSDSSQVHYIRYRSSNFNNVCHLTDIRFHPFYLTEPEIKAIYEQQTSLDKVDFLPYFTSREVTESRRCWSFSIGGYWY